MNIAQLRSALPYAGRQLLSQKRCWGSHATITFVVGPGATSKTYGTLAELEADGTIPEGFIHLDPFLSAVPSSREGWDGREIVPMSEPTNAISKRDQAAARKRRDLKRKEIIEQEQNKMNPYELEPL